MNFGYNGTVSINIHSQIFLQQSQHNKTKLQVEVSFSLLFHDKDIVSPDQV